jgi:hypothetical protein
MRDSIGCTVRKCRKEAADDKKVKCAVTDNMGQKIESMPRIPYDSPVDDCPTTITHGTYGKFYE